MARYRKPIYSRSYRMPSLLNRLLFRLAVLNPLTPKEFPMSSRRNVLIRTVTAVLGDVATGIAVASACVWLIEAATLGLFLSFLTWLIGALAALALSQYLVHPAVALLLSDRKLDVSIAALAEVADQVMLVGPQIAQQLWQRFMPKTQL